MFRNYFITTIRNLFRNKVGSIINITGLAVSIACCIAIYVFLKHEETFDNFHSKADRIYRMVLESKTAQGTDHLGYVAFPTARALRTDFPNLETVTQMYVGNKVIVQIPDAVAGTKKFEEKETTYADEFFFKTFDFSLIAGSTNKILSTPDEVVLSKTLADNYFSKEYSGRYNELIGKTITVNKKPYRISGIMQDMPRNSNIACNMLLPFKEFEVNNQSLMQNWQDFWSEAYTFVTLPKNYTAQQFDKDLIAFRNKYLDRENAKTQTFHAQPLLQVHTDELYGGTYYATPSILIIAFLTMGIIVLLTACINFINLATAQSLQRAKEIGIRKTLGSRNWQLIVRFMIETLVLVLIASGVGLLLADWFLHQFNKYLAFIVNLNLHIDTSIVVFLLVLALAITFLAGYYPARIMAGYQPIQALKGSLKATGTGFKNRFSFRKGLVTTQFVVTQLLIIGTIVVSTQLHYFYSHNAGYQKEGVLTVEMPDNDQQKITVFRNALMNHPQVKDVTFCSGPPMSASNAFSNMRLPASAKKDNINTERKYVDPGYLSVFKIPLVAGRNLQVLDKVLVKNDSINQYNILVNQKAVSALGFKNAEAAIGQTITIDDKDRATIVGVTRNFDNVSIQSDINPCFMYYATNWIAMANIKMSAVDNTNALTQIKKDWETLYPDQVYKSMTLEDYIQHKAFYVMEDIMYQGFKIFAVLSIIIGCMGLYGLVSFLAIQRQKEIGIRKVLGASVNSILYLFSKEFTWLVLIAFLIAAPVGYWAMNSWLQTFANRIELQVSYFVVTLMLSLLIAIGTIGFQAIKAAIANPVKSLRRE
jgi:putative ABC transport system permease protein